MADRTPPFFDRARLAELLERHGADLLLVCSRQNIGYVADYTYYVGQGLPTILEDGREWSMAYVGVPRDPRRDPFMTIQTAEEHIVAFADPWIEDRRVWGPTFRFGHGQGARLSPSSAPEQVMDAVVEALRDLGLAEGVIALETSAMPANMYERLREALPGLRIADPWPILWELRLHKTDDEIARLRRVAEITDAALGDGYAALHDGLTELGLRDVVAAGMASRGADFGWTSVAYGPKGQLVVEPTSLLPVAGEVVRVDLVGTWHGYYSDMSRVGVFGQPPSPEIARAHDAILSANQLLHREAGPGVACSTLYRLASESIAASGYQTLALEAGHGIGRDVGEPPYLTGWDDTVLRPGMVICLEPAVRLAGIGSVNVEDMVVITDNGCESLTAFPRDLRVWPSGVPAAGTAT